MPGGNPNRRVHGHRPCGIGDVTLKSRIGHHVLSGSTIGLLPSYRWRGDIVVIELAERGTYRGYGTLPEIRDEVRAQAQGARCIRGLRRAIVV